jgi:hypothetical protein
MPSGGAFLSCCREVSKGVLYGAGMLRLGVGGLGGVIARGDDFGGSVTYVEGRNAAGATRQGSLLGTSIYALDQLRVGVL